MLKLILLGGAIASAGPAVGQDMDHSPHAMHGSDSTAPWQPGSGTSRPPGFEPMTGAHIMSGDWQLMAHGYAWGAYSDQGGPRGSEKAFVQSMAMLDASRPLGAGAGLQLRAVACLESQRGKGGKTGRACE